MADRDTLIRDYTSGPVARQLLGFAWPFMLSNLLQTAYNLTDMVVVGQFVGPAGLSGPTSSTCTPSSAWASATPGRC